MRNVVPQRMLVIMGIMGKAMLTVAERRGPSALSCAEHLSNWLAFIGLLRYSCVERPGPVAPGI